MAGSMKPHSSFPFLFDRVFLTCSTCQSQFASKAAEGREKTETERHLQNEFVNMTFGKTFPVGSESRYLVTSKAVTRTKWI